MNDKFMVGLLSLMITMAALSEARELAIAREELAAHRCGTLLNQ